MQIRRLTRDTVRRFLPERAPGINKGDCGRVLVVAGSAGMSGAAVLCARAALRCGAGLVTAAVPEPLLAAFYSMPEAMTLPLSGTSAENKLKIIEDWVRRRGCDVCAAGPGLSLSSEAVKLSAGLLKRLDRPILADADMLNAVASSGDISLFRATPAPKILTPHPGEIARLLGGPVPSGREERASAALALAAKSGAVVVLKGMGTLITDGKIIYENTSGGPELAKAGSGDVLAGGMAALWAQAGKAGGFSLSTALKSAAAGVFIHGLAGGMETAARGSFGLLASETADSMPLAIDFINSVHGRKRDAGQEK